MSNAIKRQNLLESGLCRDATLPFIPFSLSVGSSGPVARFESGSGLVFALITEQIHVQCFVPRALKLVYNSEKREGFLLIDITIFWDMTLCILIQ
jgi:hypothetical protein